MQHNSDSIILDTSCLILLSKIDEFGLLKLPGRKIITTPQVATEFKISLPEWIKIEKPPAGLYRKISKMKLDKGEASIRRTEKPLLNRRTEKPINFEQMKGLKQRNRETDKF